MDETNIEDVDKESVAWKRYNVRMDEIEMEVDNDEELTTAELEKEIEKWKK